MIFVKGSIEDVTIEDVSMDCARRGGGVYTENALRVHLARLYVVHFATIGISIHKGHEVHITDSFVGEFLWGEATRDELTGTAVEIDGQDHWISDIIVFSGLYGIVLNGGASVLTNTHIYNGGQEGLRVRGTAIRVLGCYFDNGDQRTGAARVVVIDPTAVDISHSMFLGATSIEIRSSGASDASILGFHAVHNQFLVGNGVPQNPPWDAIYVNETQGPFWSVNGTVIDRNTNPPADWGPFIGQKMRIKGTVSELTLEQQNTTRWNFDLAEKLLFPHKLAPIQLTYSVQATAGFPEVVARPIKSTNVLLESRQPFTGTIHLQVSQGGHV